MLKEVYHLDEDGHTLGRISHTKNNGKTATVTAKKTKDYVVKLIEAKDL